MNRRVSVVKYKVPYLREKVIEEHAEMLLGEWANDHPALVEPPVPIEEILEIGLRLDFEICDLQTELGHPDVLGGIWFGDRRIKVDQSLDPSKTPKMLGRYRFTLAHEVGHWRQSSSSFGNSSSSGMVRMTSSVCIDGTPKQCSCTGAHAARSLSKVWHQLQA